MTICDRRSQVGWPWAKFSGISIFNLFHFWENFSENMLNLSFERNARFFPEFRSLFIHFCNVPFFPFAFCLYLCVQGNNYFLINEDVGIRHHYRHPWHT